MKFHVLGANKDTGDDVEVDLVAADTRQAESIAHDRGILVASLKPVEAPAALDTIELEPESDTTTTTVAHAPAPDPHAGHKPHAPAPQHDAPAPAPANHDAHAHDAHGHDAHAHGHAPQDGHAAAGAHHTEGAPHSSTHIEYRVLLNQSLFLMEKAVCRALEEGWEPTGGIATAFQNNATSYFQAMIRYPKPPELAQD